MSHAEVLDWHSQQPAQVPAFAAILQDKAAAEAATSLPAAEQATEEKMLADVQGREAGPHAGEFHFSAISVPHRAEHARLTNFISGLDRRPEPERRLIEDVVHVGYEAALGDGVAQPQPIEALAAAGAGYAAMPERLEQQPLSAELLSMPEKLAARIEKAVAASEFADSPELRQALEGYYVDHNRLATIIERVADNTVELADAQQILDGGFDGPSYVMDEAIKQLIAAQMRPNGRESALQQAAELTTRMLYNEVCVGAMTVEPEDLQQIAQVYAKVRQAAVNEGFAYRLHEAGGEQYYWTGEHKSADNYFAATVQNDEQLAGTIARRAKLGDEAWDDSRYAGQLLFHNTPFMNDIAHPGNDGTAAFSLRSRSQRLKAEGTYKATTLKYDGGHDMHTNAVHWSEHFMPRAYKIPKTPKQEGAYYPATIGVPLAEIIKAAPFGRDCRYGSLQLKDPSSHHDVPVNDTLNLQDDFPGMRDTMGRDGKDRVFYGDSNDPDKGHNYVLNAGADMSTESGNVSRIIQLQGDYNHFRMVVVDADAVSGSPGSLPDYGAGQGIPQVHNLPYDVPLYRPPVKPGQRLLEGVEPRYQAEMGIGPYADLGNAMEPSGSFRGGISKQEQQGELADQIAELQRQSRELPQYKNRLIVPLRQGVMRYNNESQNNEKAFSGVGAGMRHAHSASLAA